MPFLSFLGRFLILLSLSSWSFAVAAQGEFYQDANFDNDIRTVQFYPTGALLLDPIISLGQIGGLRLEFDDLYGDFTEYWVTVVHCNADWTPSDLNNFEYLESYTDDMIRDFEYSYQTNTTFTHYWMDLPNENLNWTKSGNYMLWVYRKVDGEKEMAFTRRFCVSENLMDVIPQVNRANSAGLRATHQEILFTVVHEDIVIRNPQVEITGSVVQNWNWNVAKTGLRPMFSRPERQEFFDRGNAIFPGTKEYRPLDIRNLRFGNAGADPAISRVGKPYLVTAPRDFDRAEAGHQNVQDLNGKFVIENRDNQLVEPYVGADYAEVMFELAYDGLAPDEEIHWLSSASGWALNDNTKMIFNPATNAYVLRQTLKMGYYDYLYVVTKKDGVEPSFEEIEGNSYETENDYAILVYYRPFGGRFDRLVATRIVDETF